MRTQPLFLFLVILVGACQPEHTSPLVETPYELTIPRGFPYPDVPEDNTLTTARVALGKRLFFDPALSRNLSVSCASCHKQELAFADDQAVSPGVDGQLGFRNSPTLANLAYLQEVNKDGGVPKLDLHALVPIEDHAELDFNILGLADRLNADPTYEADFLKAYDDAANPFTITRALGAFLRTLISGNSTYDQYLAGNTSLNAEALAGEALFFSERTNCGSCHTGFNFTDNSFRNNGLYADYEDTGRQRVTILAEDVGKFRVPTLRNINLTRPYMHDGSLPDLAAVLEHYNKGGKDHPNQDPRIRPLHLTDEEQQQIIAFLHTLTDATFLTNPAFQQ